MSNATQTFRGVVSLEQGTKIHEFDTASTTDSVSVDVASHTVAAGKILKLTQVDVSSSVEGLAEVFDGATRIGVLRIGAAQKNPTLFFNPSRDIAASATIKVAFTGCKTGGDVEALIQGSEL